MALLNKMFTIGILFLFILPLFNSVDSVQISGEKLDERIIRIAQYPRQTPSEQLFEIIFNYTWEINNTVYKFSYKELTLDEMKGGGERPLNNDNFDLLVVGATFNSFSRDGLDPRISENVKDFLSQGGGYLSSCGGTIFSTQGYENPKTWYEGGV